jgi:hypothetical protein
VAKENKSEVKVENLQREAKELTPEEAKEVKGGKGLKAAPTVTGDEAAPQI